MRNCVLSVVALLAAASPSSRELGFMDFLSLVMASFTLILLYGAINQLLVNRNIIGAWLNSPGSNSHG